MNCSPERIAGYLDGELDAGESIAMEEHLASCRQCSDTYTRLRRQQAAIRAENLSYRAPAELRASLRSALREREARTGRAPSLHFWQWLAAAASVLLAISVSWNVAQFRRQAASPDTAESVVDGHIRSLLGSRLVDIASSDHHTVKPWFAGKLDFSPPVKELAAEGFPLAGARVDYLAGRRVAALVYHRNQHVITLFIWPGPPPRGAGQLVRNGYNIRHWDDGTMAYWAVSDASAQELTNFEALFRSPMTAHAWWGRPPACRRSDPIRANGLNS